MPRHLFTVNTRGEVLWYCRAYIIRLKKFEIFTCNSEIRGKVLQLVNCRLLGYFLELRSSFKYPDAYLDSGVYFIAWDAFIPGVFEPGFNTISLEFFHGPMKIRKYIEFYCGSPPIKSN